MPYGPQSDRVDEQEPDSAAMPRELPNTADTANRRRATLVPLLVAGAFFMEYLDATVITTALPQMAVSLGTDPVSLGAGIASYVLALAVFIPISGFMADRFGARTIFASAIAVFTLASILCGISGTLVAFVAARVLQGAGGAMMVPVGRLLVLRGTEKRDLVRAIGTLTWPGLVAPVLGPALGGLITTYANWRWIFLLNVPLGLIGIVLALVLIRSEKREAAQGFDLLGFVLVGSTCAGLMYGFDLFGRPDPPWMTALGSVVIGLLAGAAALRHLLRSPKPLIDLRVLRFPTFSRAIFGGSLYRIAIGSAPFLLPLMFQVGFGRSAFQSGLLLLWVFAGNLLMKPFTTSVMRRFGFRNILIVNAVLSAATFVLCALIGPATPEPLVGALLFVSGLCRSTQYTALNTLAFVDVPTPEMGSANVLNTMVFQFGTGLGIVFGAIALHMAGWIHAGPGAAMTLTEFRFAFLAVAALAILSILDFVRLGHDAGDEVSGYRQAIG